MGLLALPSHLLTLDQQVSVIVLLIGLAVGVDYAMFYLKREREERAAGRSERAALEAAAATSGRPPGQISMALDRPRNPGPSVWAILGSNQ